MPLKLQNMPHMMGARSNQGMGNNMVTCADPEGGVPPLENYKNIGFLSNTGLDPLKNHKATKPVFNVRPSSTRQRSAIQITFRWRANDGPILVVLVVFGSTH